MNTSSKTSCSIDSESQLPREQLAIQAPMTPHPVSTLLGWVFLVTSLLLEILSAVLEQLSSPSHHWYAFSGMLVSLLAAVICILELIHKGCLPETGSSPSSSSTIMRCSYSLCDFYGLLSALSQLILSAIRYSYHIRHANDPVNLSVLPVIFLACVVASKLIPTNHHIHAENINSSSNLSQQQTPADTIISIPSETNIPQQQTQAENIISIPIHANQLPQHTHIGDGETIFIPTETTNIPQQQTPAADATETININSTSAEANQLPQQHTIAETISSTSAEANLYKPKLTPTLSRRSAPAQNQNQISCLVDERVGSDDGDGSEDGGTVAGPPGTEGGGRAGSASSSREKKM